MLQTAGAPAATTHPVAEAGTIIHQPLRHIAVRQFCLTEGSGYTGKRRRENSDEGDDEAGPSKKPRTGVQACFLFCSVLHPVDEFAVWGVSGWCEGVAPLAFCEDL